MMVSSRKNHIFKFCLHEFRPLEVKRVSTDKISSEISFGHGKNLCKIGGNILFT